MSDVTAPARVGAAGSGLDVVYVLSLLQVAFLLLAAVGEVVLMGGNPAYLLLPVVKSALLIVFATRALARRRWALRALTVLAWITLVGFALQLVIGLFPAVDFTVNLVGLMTNVALPAAVILLCRPDLKAIKQARRAARAQALVVPQDPYLPVPVTVPMGQSQPYGPPPGVPIVYPPVVHGPPIATPTAIPTATPGPPAAPAPTAAPAVAPAPARAGSEWAAPR